MKNSTISRVLIVSFVTIIHVFLFLLFNRFHEDESFLDNDKRILLPVKYKVENELISRGIVFTPTLVKLTNRFDSTLLVGLTTIGRVVPVAWIELNRKYFKAAPAEVKEALLLHEYGHYLGLNHSPDAYIFMNTLFCPTSVMHPTDSMSLCFNANRDYYYSVLVKQVLDLH
jgi:hypothetical protein